MTMTKGTSLEVWMNGEAVGTWSVSSGGKHEFFYLDSWMVSLNSRPVSLSMPLQSYENPHRGHVVEDYFDNLLPDSALIRRRIQKRFGCSSSAISLLSEIGRDCVGALQLLPQGVRPEDLKRITGTPVNNQEIGKHLRVTVNDPTLRLDNDAPFRISIAGAQEKTGLLYHNSQWYIPDGTTPTTHIFKLPLGTVTNYEIDLSTSVENEWLCLKIVELYGLPAVNAEILTFEGQKVLSVERFDRRLAADSNWFMRLPVEDFCQVYGISAEKKYESDGGPGIQEISNTLLGSVRSKEDRRTFFKTQIIFWLLAATDGHAKNFSIFIERNGAFQLTPIYDVISALPIIGRGPNKLPLQKVKMAMAVRGKSKHYNWNEITRRHWLHMSNLCGVDGQSLLEEIIEETPHVISKAEKIIPQVFPTFVAESVLTGIVNSVKRLRA